MATWEAPNEMTIETVRPSARISDSETLRRESVVLERNLRVWDRHIGRCAECLAQGEHLCYEGEYLTEQVVEAREAVRLADVRAARGPVFLPRRRPTLPGVPA